MPIPEANPPASMTIAEALERAHAHWHAGQAQQAEALCQRILAAAPGQPVALHLLGLMAHAYDKLDMAVDFMRQACQAPGAPAGFFSNLAEMCRQRGLLTEGEAAARRALALDPALVSAWTNLGILLQEMGQFDESLRCLERVVALQPDAAEAHNNLANTYRRLERMDAADAHYRQAIALKPDYAQAHSNLAFLLSSQGDFDGAVTAARQAISIDPRFVDAYLNVADAEAGRHCYDAALRVLNSLRSFAPQHPAALGAMAKILKKTERYDEALVLARQAVAAAPHSADAHHALAQALQSLGETEDALAAFETAARLPGTLVEDAMIGRASLLLEAGRKPEALAAFDAALRAFPGSVQVMTARADAHTFEPGSPEFAPLEDYLAQGDKRPLQQRISVHFALGKAYMDVGDSVRAFEHLDAGNRHKRASIQYDPGATSTWVESIADVFPASLYEAFADAGAGAASAGAASELPVFIVGMPRSGTTLIEQIIGSHPQVTGAGELSALRHVMDAQGAYPGFVPSLSAHDLARMGQAYLQRVMPLARSSARLVDKMPSNFLYAGLIPLMLPGARIIHARRNAVDTCLSCYTKLFGGEQAFAYDQSELGRFYLDYMRLMNHLREVLPAGRFIEIDYEAVVGDLEGEARRLIDFLGLPWDNACLAFHKSTRVVRTASVNQVRQPIYTTSRDRWRKHAAQLGPLLAALGIGEQSDRTL